MTQSFDEAIAAFAPTLPLAVAFSGGADSTALLAACALRWPGQVCAFHVNHGLQAAAAEFERHCAALCERVAVPLYVLRVDARHASGDSPEDAARRARYGALASLVSTAAERGDVVASLALGHHADDQVETLLLALSRGAGLRGLSAMPASAVRHGVPMHRPLLQVGASDIRAWLTRRGLPWIDDPTNTDSRYTRNRIRAVVLPALEQAFPQFRTTFGRSAAHVAQGQELLDELAAQDLDAVGVPPRIAGLQALSPARQGNLLRYWLARHHACAPSTAQLEEVLRQIAACRTRGNGISLKVAGGWLERVGDILRWYNFPPPPKP